MIERPQKPSDLAPLFEIYRTAFHTYIEAYWGWNDARQRTEFARHLESSEWIVIENDEHEDDEAHDAQEILGFVELDPRPNDLYLRNIALTPSSRGQGIGTRLITDLQARASEENRTITLRVFETNTQAIRFYERLGFHRAPEERPFVLFTWSAR